MDISKNRSLNSGSYNRPKTLVYNHLHKPNSITLPGGTITYTYAADGTKLQIIPSEGTYNYIGGFFYKDDVLQHFSHEEGQTNVVELIDAKSLPADHERLQSDGSFRSYINGNNGLFAQWDNSAPSATYAHEFLHLLSLVDMYYEWEIPDSLASWAAGILSDEGTDNYDGIPKNALIGKAANGGNPSLS